MKKSKSLYIRQTVLIGVLTALVVVLQLISSVIKFGPFSITLALIPIVVGAAICGPLAGAWLGLAFGLTVLISGDATWFMEYNAAGTVLTVLCKGAGAGAAAGFVYMAFKSFSGKGRYLGAVLAALSAPIANTGLFVVGCMIFFTGLVGGLKTVILSVVGLNFLVEIGTIVLLAPVVVRVIDIWQKRRK